jgi:AAA+ ATPase superfamily predicted ATPase
MRELLEEVGGSLEGIGSVRLKFRAQEVDETVLLEAALDFPERLAQEQDGSVLVILDEFQALARFNEGLFALFKERLEAQRRVVYLFSGSSLRLLHEVFGREGKSPLYQMVGRLFLREIPEEDVRRFYRTRLREVHGVEITGAALDRVIERVGGIPYYFQKLGVTLERRLVLQGIRHVGVSEVEEAFRELIEELSADFQERWETRFSEQQRAILQQLAQGPQTATEVARSLGVIASNLSYNLGRLTEAMVLTKEGHSYQITDRVFAAWIRSL